MTIDNLIEMAELHSSRLQDDIKLCLNRQDHVRVTSRANEAEELLRLIKTLSGIIDV